jgi:hypothetical protein
MNVVGQPTKLEAEAVYHFLARARVFEAETPVARAERL